MKIRSAILLTSLGRVDKLICEAMKREVKSSKEVKGELISISDPFTDAEWVHFGRKGYFSFSTKS